MSSGARVELDQVSDERLPLPTRPSRTLLDRLLEVPIREAKRLEERILARTQIDMGGIGAGLRARLSSRLPLQPLPVAADLQVGRALFGQWWCKTEAWDAPRLRKVALSQIRMLPMVEGLALVLLPSPELDYPVLACDLMALPARLSLNLELYGAPALRPTMQSILAPHEASLAQLRNRQGKEWSEVLASGHGVHARVDPRRAEECSATLFAVVGQYLQGLAEARPGELGAASQRTFFAAFHEHGPRRGPLGRVLGADWAERYSRLIFE